MLCCEFKIFSILDNKEKAFWKGFNILLLAFLNPYDSKASFWKYLYLSKSNAIHIGDMGLWQRTGTQAGTLWPVTPTSGSERRQPRIWFPSRGSSVTVCNGTCNLAEPQFPHCEMGKQSFISRQGDLRIQKNAVSCVVLAAQCLTHGVQSSYGWLTTLSPHTILTHSWEKARETRFRFLLLHPLVLWMLQNIRALKRGIWMLHSSCRSVVTMKEMVPIDTRKESHPANTKSYAVG